MKYIKKDIFYILALLICFQLFQIECQPPKDTSQLRNELKQKTDMYTSMKNELELYNIYFNVLIGVIILFSLIIFSFTIYEIINCRRRKKEDLIKKTIIRNSFNSSKLGESKFQNNSQIQSNIYYSGNSNLQISKESKESFSNSHKQSIDSFHSSNISESVKSKEEKAYVNDDNEISNNFIEKPNLKESIEFRNRENSGYEAPLVQTIKQNNNEEKYLTNDGNEEKKNIKFLDNPY